LRIQLPQGQGLIELQQGFGSIENWALTRTVLPQRLSFINDLAPTVLGSLKDWAPLKIRHIYLRIRLLQGFGYKSIGLQKDWTPSRIRLS
jgi:hypothetical protein